MRRKRKTEITLEIEETLILRRPGRLVSVWCEDCAATVSMISVDEADAVSGLRSRAICRSNRVRKVSLRGNGRRVLAGLGQFTERLGRLFQLLATAEKDGINNDNL